MSDPSKSVEPNRVLKLSDVEPITAVDHTGRVEMDRVLITGGMGFLGSHLTQRFLDRGCEVWALDLFEAPCAEIFKQYDKYHLIIDTIKNLETLRKLVDRCDLVCHLAAVACPDQYISKTRKVMDITLRSGLDVVELIRLTGKFLFFTSTSEVYGRNPKVPWKEDDDRVLGSTDIDRWCYSSAKATLEHYIRACHLDEQLNYLNIRVFNCYGPRLRDRVVDRFVDAAIGQEPLHIHGDGSHTRCFTYVDDLIDGTLQLLDTPSAHNRVYNIGNTLETSVLELAQTVNRIAGQPEDQLRFTPHSVAMGKRYEDIPRRIPDCSRIQSAVGWKATTSLSDGLQQMMQYRRAELGLDG